MLDHKARLWRLPPLIVSTLLVVPSLAAFFQVQDLGVFGSDTHSEARALNDHGIVVGFSGTSDSAHAVMWQHGRIVELGAVPGAATFARDINHHGLIVGRSGGASPRALLWVEGSMINLGGLPGANFAEASDVNDRGQILGTSGNSLIPDNYAVIWERGAIRRLFPVGNGDLVTGLNKHGQVTATLFGADEGPFGHTWADGVLTRLPMLPGAQFSTAEDINDAGWIVGSSGTASGEVHAVLWRDGRVIDLGLAPGGIDVATATAVNNRGQVVGYGSTPTDLAGFLWERGQMTPLGGPPGSTIMLPLALNNRGQAAGTGRVPAFPATSHAVLWEGLRHSGSGSHPVR